MAHNEKVFLPIWLSYYSRFFAPEDIYIIDHDSTDGSIEKAKKDFKFNVETVHHPTVHDNRFMLKTITDKQHKLLKKYELVVYSDADEIILPDPISYKGLSDYIIRFKHSVIACNSRSVVQQPAEQAIDLSKPILSQRSVWFSEYLYNKPLVSRVPLNWAKGLHQALNINGNAYVIPVDRELVLLHLSRMDLGVRKARGESIAKEKWGAEEGIAMQWQFKGKELEEWFYNPPNLPIAPAPQKQLNSASGTGGFNTLLEYIPNRFYNLE